LKLIWAVAAAAAAAIAATLQVTGGEDDSAVFVVIIFSFCERALEHSDVNGLKRFSVGMVEQLGMN
jgi:hypothetical protein